MPAPITFDQVQQWLNDTTIVLDRGDASWQDLAGEAQTQVFSRLSKYYDTSAWTVTEEANDVPSVVRSIISMLVASWVYSRAFAESVGEGENNWATYLRELAEALMTQLVDGTIQLDDPLLELSPASPSFYPNDLTGTTQQYDASGAPVGDEYAADRKFYMGKVF